MRGDETIKRVLEQRASEDGRERRGATPPTEAELDRALEEGAEDGGGERAPREGTSSERR